MLDGRTFLITAGPTWEAIDPVRGITNHSSGKMGYALAHAAADLGAQVFLVSGPVCIHPRKDIGVTRIQSAEQMFDSVHQHIAQHDIDVFISVAAVADYRPADIATQKIKKAGDQITLTLLKNPDIVASVASLSQKRPYSVGFAAETQDVERYAHGKLIAKNLDMIIANDVSDQSIGFGSDLNRVIMITREESIDLGKHDKDKLASSILTQISNKLK